MEAYCNNACIPLTMHFMSIQVTFDETIHVLIPTNEWGLQHTYRCNRKELDSLFLGHGSAISLHPDVCCFVPPYPNDNVFFNEKRVDCDNYIILFAESNKNIGDSGLDR